MKTRMTQTEDLFLRIFRGVVVFAMCAALIGMIGLLIFSGYQFSLSPKEPIPAQKAPLKEIKIDGLKNYLIEREKAEASKTDAQRQSGQEKAVSLRYQEEATALFRCAEEFGRKVGAEVSEKNDIAKAQELQWLRTMIEGMSSASPLRGEVWVRALLPFACSALEDPSIVELRREKKVKSVFLPLVEFHMHAWDAVQTEKLNFERKEESRVAAERAAETLRIATARALAVSCLTVAGALFGAFMLLALYLIAAKIEINLRGINRSLEASTSRGNAVQASLS